MSERKPPKNDGFGPKKKKEQKFPPALCEELQKAGLATDDLLCCCTGDMDNDACYREAWLAFDKKGFYIAFGKSEVLKSKNRKKTLETKYTVDEITAVPVEEIDSFELEQYVSTGRLIRNYNGEQTSVTRFSIGLAGDFDGFRKAFDEFKETGEYIYHGGEDEEQNKCKKCGEPCPPGQEYCRKHNKSSATAVRLFKFFGGHWAQIAVILMLMILEAAISVIVPQLSTRTLYDKVFANPDGLTQAQLLKMLGSLVLGIVGIRVVRVLFQATENWVTGSIMPRIMFNLKTKIFNSMQRLSLSFYSSKQTGSLMDRILRDANNIYNFFVDGVPQIIVSIATMTGVLIVMFRMSWKLTLLAIFAMPVLFLTLVLGDRLFRNMHHRTWRYQAKVSSITSDNINGQRVIKAFAREDDEFDNFSKASEELRKAELRLSLAEATLYPLLEILVFLLSTVVLGIGGTMVAKGKITTGTLLSYIVYLEMLKQPFSFMAWVSNWWARCADSAQRVFEVCDAKPDITEKEDAVSLDDMRGDVELRELDFEYEPAHPVIRRMNLKIEAGCMLGIVGKTGAGKTTIANLISRLYDAKEGSVLIDGIDVRDIKLEDIRKNVGMVSQDIYLFIGSVADNIRYAKPDATMDEVIAAAKAASAHDFIMKLPDAYETRVGSGGQRLSGGERQRISIARTIIQNPKILILDEATAAMDTETERRIQASLTSLKKGRTTIAIAHRLSTLRDSDYLAVIDEGKVIEYGTYRELLQQKGEFYKQYKIQSEALKTIGIISYESGEAPEDDDEKKEE
ncbi:MAG: ABC transporter ATP-binding protein [Clostridia bacterium]|nr:ABC transporter ATP-binding protein [Clostridia bacterium]